MSKRTSSLVFVSALLVPMVAHAGGVLFLDRCAQACSYSPGFDDSATNKSSVIAQTSSLSAFAWGDASWSSVVDCVRETFAPFDVEVTDVDPTTTLHLEIAVAGLPSQLGIPIGVSNVAPITCSGDRVVDGGIGFAFANASGNAPLEICWNAAQAAGSLLGLDHVLLATDVMTTLTGALPKEFEDVAASCGELQPRTCACGGTTQNSYQWLRTTLPEPDAMTGLASAVLALAWRFARTAPYASPQISATRARPSSRRT